MGREGGVLGGQRTYTILHTTPTPPSTLSHPPRPTPAPQVFRYVAKATIEERMLQLQERKRALALSAFDRRKPEEGRQMRIDDVQLLLSL